MKKLFSIHVTIKDDRVFSELLTNPADSEAYKTGVKLAAEHLRELNHKVAEMEASKKQKS